MSLIVNHLTKTYGQQNAVDDLSFSVNQGTILGFLGPNGAGKSTTMKIISGYLTPTSGSAEVCGFNVLEDPLSARKQIGYLPEHNPLYLEMYVREYLEFVAGIHGIKQKKQQVKSLIEKTGLGKEQHKKIGMLSKGYRQRVGLAQALIHDPQVIILDEPTSGLDMNQLVEIRSLIKTLGEEKTVILSTHIMQEVEALCDRVIIINNGKLIADDPIDDLRSRMSGDTLINVIFQQSPKDISLLKQIEGVDRVVQNGKNIQIFTSDRIDVRAQIFHTAVKQNWVIIGMTKDESNVEDVFRKLTTQN